MKLHLGCGPVYLDGYVNVDVEAPHHYLASERPDLVAANITTVENYYKHQVSKEDILSRRLQKQEVVVDRYGAIMGFSEDKIEEIRLVQVFEHLTFDEGVEAINYWYRVLSSGGKLHLDVPDLDGTVEGYANATSLEEKLWYRRLLFGSQKNEYGLHKSMYNQEMLYSLLSGAGFKDIQILPNIHFYPAFAIEGTK